MKQDTYSKLEPLLRELRDLELVTGRGYNVRIGTETSFSPTVVELIKRAATTAADARIVEIKTQLVAELQG